MGAGGGHFSLYRFGINNLEFHDLTGKEKQQVLK